MRPQGRLVEGRPVGPVARNGMRAAFFGVLARRFTCRSQGWPGSSCTISPCVTNDMGGKTAIADFNDVALNGRRVSLRKLLEMASDTTVSRPCGWPRSARRWTGPSWPHKHVRRVPWRASPVGNPPASGFRALRDGGRFNPWRTNTSGTRVLRVQGHDRPASLAHR